MSILVLGASGMLGHAVHRVLHDAGLDVVGSIRGARPARAPARLRYVESGDLVEVAELRRILAETRPSVVVNAAGLIKQHEAAADHDALFAINAVMPQRLGFVAREAGARVLHFSTDCVFAGTRGDYREEDVPDAGDAYGLSKFLGELTAEHCLTLRTSIIGRGLVPNASLVDWLLSRSGDVRGFTRAVFSGLPTNEIGALLVRILPAMSRGLHGLYHLSADPIDKCALLTLVAQRWQRADLRIVPDESLRIDRSLDSTRLRREWGIVPDPWDRLIDRMYRFYETET